MTKTTDALVEELEARSTEGDDMNWCKTCNAAHTNDVKRVIRCMTCVVVPMKPPTKYKPQETP